MSLINTTQLTRYYGSRVGVRQLDLNIEAGTIFGFLGPNGAGKSTTIRLLLGFLRPTAGSARIMDRDCWKQSHQIKRDVSYLPGDLRLYPWFTGMNALRIWGRIRKMDLETTGCELGERFNLDMSVPVSDMSRGMRQKLGLILALAPKPRLMILDEPTSGLDPIMQEALADHIRELAAQGHTIFFSSHSLHEVESLCDHVALVRDGQLILNETLSSLQRKATREVMVEFKTEEKATQCTLPQFLKITRRTDTRWYGHLIGKPSDLMLWAAQQDIVDITITPPDLETLFHQHYHHPDSHPADSSPVQSEGSES